MKDADASVAIIFARSEARGKTQSEQATVEELYDQFGPSLFRYAFALLSSAEDAEDAVQEVFVRVARESKRLAKVRNPKTYLFAATRNAAYSVLRSRQRKQELQDAIQGDVQSRSESGGPDGVAECAALGEAFEKLPTEQREVLVLKVFEQMTFREIAGAVGASINTVASRYRYGIARLRDALGGGCDE